MSTTSGKEQKTIFQIQEKTSDRNKRNNRNKRNKRFRDKVSANNKLYYYNNYLVLLANTAKITYLFFLLVTVVTLVTLVAVTLKWLFFKLLNHF